MSDGTRVALKAPESLYQSNSAQTTAWSDAPGASRGVVSTSAALHFAAMGRVARMWSIRQPQLF
jgi:hypothetical protein